MLKTRLKSSSAPIIKEALDVINRHEEIILKQRKRLNIAEELLKNSGGPAYRWYVQQSYRVT